MSAKKRQPRVVTDLKDLELEQQAQAEHEELQDSLASAADMYKQELKKEKKPEVQKEEEVKVEIKLPENGKLFVNVTHSTGEVDKIELSVDEWMKMCQALKEPAAESTPSVKIVSPFTKEN